MQPIVTDFFNLFSLQCFVGAVPPEPHLILRLYSNDVEPDAADSNPERYEEVQGDGYAPIELSPDDWEIVGRPPVLTFSDQQFLYRGPPAAGFFVTGERSGQVCMAARIEITPGQLYDRPDGRKQVKLGFHPPIRLSRRASNN